MKKMSKAARSNLLNGGIIVVTLAVVLYVSAKGGDIGDAWRAVRSATIMRRVPATRRSTSRVSCTARTTSTPGPSAPLAGMSQKGLPERSGGPF